MASIIDHRKEIKMEEYLLTEADLAEFEADLAELTDTERHILLRLMELHPVEDVPNILDSMGDGSEIPEYRFTEVDPYARCTVTAAKERSGNYEIGEDGCIRVKNPSAYWIPKLTVTEVIAGTVYTVTGSYEGTESFARKLERITAKNFSNKLEDTE